MVQARDNRAVVRGRVHTIGELDPTGAAVPVGWTAVGMEVLGTEDVEDLPNLVAPLAGSSAVVYVPDVDLAAAEVAVGDTVELSGRLAGPRRVMADRASLARARD